MVQETLLLHPFLGDLLSVLCDTNRGEKEQREKRGGIRMRLSFPLVAGAVVVGVISGNVIFGPPLAKYWAQKQQEEAAKEGQAGST